MHKNLYARLRQKMEVENKKGKRVFTEAIGSYLDLYGEAPVNTVRSRLIYLEPENGNGIPGLEFGELLDEQSNLMIPYCFFMPDTEPLLVYQKHIVAHTHTNMSRENILKESKAGMWSCCNNTVLMTSFQLHNFNRARFAPRNAWIRVIEYIAEWLTGNKPSYIPESVVSYGVDEDLSDSNAFEKCRRNAIEKGIRWLEQFLIEDGYGGIREGLQHDIDPDGNQIMASGVRTDCTGESAGAFKMYRGFYHDITRGKIPTVETLKALIDQMAYYKMNSLQLYMEHTFPFKELGQNAEKNGYISAEEIKEIDNYCYENFIELIPSIATFGHLYELLQQEPYRELREMIDFREEQLYWLQRMQHHTINPTDERSIEIVKSMIDQVAPLFRSNLFNICCDETFDLEHGVHKGQNTGKLYIDFVRKIINHLCSKGKKVMMWADILLKYPEVIEEIKEDVEFLNWDYCAEPAEDPFKKIGTMRYTQIVCPGTTTWSRLVENVEVCAKNILKLGDYGYKYNAKGMLITNWGDFGNPCSLDLSMHGMVLGASKSWNKDTCLNNDFEDCLNRLLYKNPYAVQILKKLSDLQTKIDWNPLALCYSNCIYEKQFDVTYPSMETILYTQNECQKIMKELEDQLWDCDEYRQEMLLAAEGILVMAELFAKIAGYEIEGQSAPEDWLNRYSAKWLQKNNRRGLVELWVDSLRIRYALPAESAYYCG